MNQFPEKLQLLIKNKTYSVDGTGMSGAAVMVFDDMVLKVQPCSGETENEYRIMKWLENKLAVPRVLAYEKEEGISYLLMTKMKGKMSCDEYYMTNQELLLKVLTDGLRALWSIDISDCPCDNRLDRKLERARYNVEHELVDMDNVEPETFGENGFRNPEELLKWLCEHRPEEEPVLSHGDFCLPNIFAEGNGICGFIDLGRMGKADKWQDIALCYRSLRHNYAGKYGGGAYGSFKAELLFEGLGVEPDWEKINYYILLDELF